MKKAILLCAAMSFAVPAFAQAPQAAPQASPMTQTAPAQSSAPAASDPSAAAPAQAAPAAPTDTAQAPAQTTGETAQQPASGGAQVAQVVDTEFATYDKNKDGVLSKAEFSDWMVALKTASDPSTKAEAASTKTWVGQAFASADKDKSRTVSKTELTGFLSQGKS
ncbi:EF-hand domain-containing protein [Sphingomonas populi]|uniref:EF-hand domain-containing protein n=1 Tax=Sphingomonas populi TaxID=2484750 RepID=A0A4V2DDQ5_9SPHN|nr:EF-hand domain-containing protein [Sphingomonas populi]RZF65808.1 EF-hand domain-containing protein [Sphingomonas populi]